MKPIAIDLYCKAGGVSWALHDAGYEVIGVDIEPQPNYPYRFVQSCALDFLNNFIRWPYLSHHGVFLSEVALIWASPPCLDNTVLRNAPNAKRHEDLIEPTRNLLAQTGKPWIIENVDSARARERLRNPVRLCGSMFGLGVGLGLGVRYHLERHRLFEASFPLAQPTKCQHRKPVIGVYGGHVRCRSAAHGGRKTSDFVGWNRSNLAADALGLPRGSMTMDEYSNAIPPAYVKWLVSQIPVDS